MKWLDDYLPDTEQWDSFRGSLLGMKDKIKDNIEIGTVSIHYTQITYLISHGIGRVHFLYDI